MARPRSGKAATKEVKQAVEQVSEEQVAGVAVMEDRNAPVGVAQVAGDDDGGAAYQAAIEALNGRFDALEKEVKHLASFVEERQASMRSEFRSDVIHVERLIGAVTDRIAAIEAHPSTKVLDKVAEDVGLAEAYEQTMSASYASTGTETVDLGESEPVTPSEVLVEVETEEPDVATGTVVEEVVEEVPAGEVVDESDETEVIVDEAVDEALEETEEEEGETEDEVVVVLDEAEDEEDEEEGETEDEVGVIVEDELDEGEEDEEEVTSAPVVATNGTGGGGTGGGTLTPAGLLALVLQAEAERPNHRIGRRQIAAAVRSVANSGTSGSIGDARRLLAAHEHIVAIWDELPEGGSGGSHEARA